MTRMVHVEARQERIFYVPVSRAIAGAPFECPAELTLVLRGAALMPAQLTVRLTPSEFDFQCQIPRLAMHGRFAASTQQLSEAAGMAQPVVIYEARRDLLERLPAGLQDVAAVEGFLAGADWVFDLGAYAIAAIEFEVRR